MDYNSRPWSYEVVGINDEGVHSSVKFENEVPARDFYNEVKKHCKTVLFCSSRKGHAFGQHEVLWKINLMVR